jgi:hypothetical protein
MFEADIYNALAYLVLLLEDEGKTGRMVAVGFCTKGRLLKPGSV